MADPSKPAQFTPRFRTDIYDFILPAKFRGALRDQVVIITGMYSAYHISFVS